ncbi:hypothetical protein PG989_006360 [Apiospora arundinis]
MAALIAKLNSDSSPTHTNSFAIEHDHERIALNMKDGSSFGYLQKKFIKPFRELHKVTTCVEIEAVGATSDILQSIHRAAKPVDARCLVDINIYGPQNQAEAIGDVLTKYRLWLQRPDSYRSSNSSYMNPHAISFPDLEEQMDIEESARHENPSPDSHQSEEEVLDQVMSEVHDGLSRDRELSMEAGDQRISTELLPHQRRALRYMLERESGDIPDEFRLWEERNLSGKMMFVHRVTEAKSPTQPEERGGGVLADEMGTGKSLATLALITRTLDSAREWLKEKQNTPTPTTKIKHFAAATLVIVPSAQLIANWTNEIDRHTGMTLETLKYHGTTREKDIDALIGYDVVLTTYSTLAADYRKPVSLLHQVAWYRVVLDEGTPIQNRLEDIGALFSFLRAEPLHNRAEFRRSICLPFENQNKALARDRLIMLYDSLVLRRSKDTCITDVPDAEEELRQLQFSPDEKDQYNRTLQMLRRRLLNQAYIQPGQMTATLGQGNDSGLFRIDGNDFRKTSLYQSLVDENASRFSLFHAMMQLRILCNHGTYQNWFSWKKHKETHNALDEREASLMDPVLSRSRLCDCCNNPLSFVDLSRGNILKNRCSHVLCLYCMNENNSSSATTGALSECPMCRSLASTLADEVQRAETDEDGDVIMAGDVGETDEILGSSSSSEPMPYFREKGTSTKVNALMDDMTKDPAGTKSIVFSCWTKTLDLIQRCMRNNNIQPLRIDGNSPFSERRRVIQSFEEDPQAQVLLMTTGTGAHGLNLTAANRIFIFELQWNPSIERQAIARAIRIGQTRQVRVTRYLIEDTVEQAIHSQQVNKRKAAAMGFPQEKVQSSYI